MSNNRKKKDKFNLIKIKHLYNKRHYQESENITYRMRENVFNHISNEVLIFTIYEELQNSGIKR